MLFSVQMSNRNDQVLASKKESERCNHEFYFKPDMGMVCSLCGLVSEDAEHIYQFTWGQVIMDLPFPSINLWYNVLLSYCEHICMV